MHWRLNTDITQQRRADLCQWCGQEPKPSFFCQVYQNMYDRTETCSSVWSFQTVSLIKNYLPNVMKSLSIINALRMTCCFCYVCPSVGSSNTKWYNIEKRPVIITVSLTAPWSWLQVVCQCPLQCCRTSAGSVKTEGNWCIQNYFEYMSGKGWHYVAAMWQNVTECDCGRNSSLWCWFETYKQQ